MGNIGIVGGVILVMYVHLNRRLENLIAGTIYDTMNLQISSDSLKDVTAYDGAAVRLMNHNHVNFKPDYLSKTGSIMVRNIDRYIFVDANICDVRNVNPRSSVIGQKEKR